MLRWLTSSVLLVGGFSAFSLVHAAFVDIDVTHPNYHAIKFLQQEGIVKGYEVEGDRFYRPRQKINRAEALKILVMAVGMDIKETEQKYFPDVTNDKWYYPYIQTGAGEKIVEGFSDGHFYPGKQVSRAEFLKMVMVGYGIPFSPSDQGDWFTPYFDTAVTLRLLDQADVSPYESLSRSEVAEFIFRAKKLAQSNFSSSYQYSGQGSVGYYGDEFVGKKTASGETYDPNDLTAAHRTLPFGTRLKISNDAGDFIVVRVNDRGPYHEDRVLDLSKRAFEQLALVSEGVVEVEFVLYLEPNDEKLPIPEQIRSKLADVTKTEQVPDVIAEKLVSRRKPDEKSQKTSEKRVITPYFQDTVAHLSQDFYPNLVLRSSFPQKVMAGSVLKVAGTAKDPGKKRVMVFLTNKVGGSEQQQFFAPVQGKNFVVPVPFYEAGTYEMGIVFDDALRSRIGTIEVENQKRARRFPARDVRFESALDVRVVPDSEEVLLRWESGENRLTKLDFSQKNLKYSLQMEDGLSAFSLPYSFFGRFREGEDVVMELSQALSKDGSLSNQETNWKLVATYRYLLTRGFPDTEEDTISVHDFLRFYRSLDPVFLDGKLLAEDIRLDSHAYLMNPEGQVRQLALEKRGDRFSLTFTPTDFGPHVLELVSDQGEVLFNRALYFHEHLVLPVMEWDQIVVRSQSVVGVREWVNKLRGRYQLPKLFADKALNEFAQQYAQKMAYEGFIGHVTPEGFDFKKRVEMAGLRGELAENLGMGSDLNLALKGLENSASHRQNILSRKWKRVGVGMTKTKKGEVYVVQIFGK